MMTMTAVLKINEELNGIELYFNSKPQQTVLSDLKSNGFRWSSYKKCWYTKQSEKALKVANSLVNNTAEEIQLENKIANNKTAKETKKAIETLSLWNATQWTELEVNREQDTKLMAKEIRTHLRKRFSQVKFSVTSSYNTLNIDIVTSPYEKGSKYLEAVYNYTQSLLNSYKYCTNYDPYGDYGSSYNLYGYVNIDWEYKQSEVTEATKKDMADFDSNLAAHEEAEQLRKEEEYKDYQKQQELKEIEYKKQREEEKKQIENVYNSITVNDLKETEQYFIIGSEFANLNKNNTLDQYKEEIEKGRYSLEDVKVTKEIHFNDQEALSYFSNLLLHDFDFLTNTGGSYTDDNRINSMTDYYNMDEEEKKTVKWNLQGVAVYFSGKLQFVVDAQGYSYARYVGLTDNATIEKTVTAEQTISNEELTELQTQANTLEDISVSVIEELNILNTWHTDNWNEYKEAMKNKLNHYNIKLSKDVIQQLDIEELKAAMYKLLVEVDGIQEQFLNADLKQGEKLTLFYISDWGTIIKSRITFDSVTPSKYAQYDNAIKLTFTPANKKKLHYKYFYSTLLVYKGWHDLPDTVLNHVEEKDGMRISRSKYHSCDNRQYDETLSYFEQQGILPVINTYKPQF
jgi:hypothetical protein